MSASTIDRAGVDWSFVRRPKWLVSHLFALVIVSGFVAAGFWQLSRLQERRDANEIVEDRALVAATPFDELVAAPYGAIDGADLDFSAVVVSGRFIDGEAVRVANRTESGRGGDWVVGLFETDSGQSLLVNRGFLLREEETAETSGDFVELFGWLRQTRVQGFLAAPDSGKGLRVPRLSVEDIQARLGVTVVPLWLQLATIDGVDPSVSDAPPDAPLVAQVPRPIPLDQLDEGNHFGYAMQWFAFAILGVVVYGLLLRKLANAIPAATDWEP